MYRHVLIAVDGSDCSLHAAKQGIELCSALHARATFITVSSDWKSIGLSELARGHLEDEAAQDLARARTLPEVAQLQARFLQEQLARVSTQGKGLLELTMKVAKDTTDTWNAIATKFAEDMKTAA